jgi:hypothetical protein
MKVKDIIDENFQDYKKPSMFISTCFFDWKCCIESAIPIYTMSEFTLAKQKNLRYQ